MIMYRRLKVLLTPSIHLLEDYIMNQMKNVKGGYLIKPKIILKDVIQIAFVYREDIKV